MSNYDYDKIRTNEKEPSCKPSECLLERYSTSLLFNGELMHIHIKATSSAGVSIYREDDQLPIQLSKVVDNFELRRLSQVFFNYFDEDYVIAKKLLDWFTGFAESDVSLLYNNEEIHSPKIKNSLVCKRDLLSSNEPALYRVVLRKPGEEGLEKERAFSARQLHSFLKHEAPETVFNSGFDFEFLSNYLVLMSDMSAAENMREKIKAYSNPPLTNSDIVFQMLDKAFRKGKPLFNARGLFISNEPTYAQLWLK